MIANGMIYRDTQIERQKENRNIKGIGVKNSMQTKNILAFYSTPLHRSMYSETNF